MKNSKPVKSPRKGQFQKGEDPRRNMAGNLNAELQSYEINFRNALAKGITPGDLAAISIEDVRRHRPGSKEFVAKWLMNEGKEKTEFSGSLHFDYSNGNGHD
jgi:hypothetical protein